MFAVIVDKFIVLHVKNLIKEDVYKNLIMNIKNLLEVGKEKVSKTKDVISV